MAQKIIDRIKYNTRETQIVHTNQNERVMRAQVKTQKQTLNKWEWKKKQKTNSLLIKTGE